MTWLDLTNAFGSIPHRSLFRTLRWAGLNEKTIYVIRRLYDGNTTSVRCGSEYTPDIPISAGVKQGCPLSPAIFKLALEPILRATAQQEKGYKLHDVSIDVLAYTDEGARIRDPRRPADRARRRQLCSHMDESQIQPKEVCHLTRRW